MNIFKWFAKTPDPTRDWPLTVSRLPPVSLRPFSLGNLKIGSPFNEIRSLGRPEKFVYNKYLWQLKYLQLPLNIEVENEVVTEISIPIGYGSMSSASEGEPVAELMIEGGARWNKNTTRQETRSVLGQPKTESDHEDEFQDSYDFGKIIMNLEFNQDEKLTYLEVFVND